MRPVALLRALSYKHPAAPVAPWPPVRSAFDRWLTSELDELRLHSHHYTTASWFSRALDLAVAVAAHATLVSSISAARGIDRDTLDAYLDDTISLLDACNTLRERLGAIKSYLDSLAVASHYIGGEYEPSDAAVSRAGVALDSCEAMEKRWVGLEKCRSNVKKLGEKAELDDEMSTPAAELREALCGSRAVAFFVMGILGVALSFKSRNGIPAVVGCGKKRTWASGLHEIQREMKEELEKRRRGGVVMLRELDSTTSAAQSMRDLIMRRERDKRAVCRGELKSAADLLKRRCGELGERVRPIGERVEELYRQIISIRVSLLGLLSYT